MSLHKHLLKALIEENSMRKAEDPKAYAKLASTGFILAHPVKIKGQDKRHDNNIPYHATIKFFDKENEKEDQAHETASKLDHQHIDPKKVGISTDKLTDRNGNDVYAVRLHGEHADKLKEHHEKFGHMGHKENYKWGAHISVPKSVHDEIKAKGHKTAHEAGIEFGPAELKRGDKTIHTYHPKVEKSEVLEKDQPQIGFPKVKNIPTRPETNVQQIGSPRQREIFARKVTQAFDPNKTASAETKEKNIKAVSNLKDKPGSGKSYPSPRGPLSAVQVGKQSGSHPTNLDAVAEHQLKVKAHNAKQTDLKRQFDESTNPKEKERIAQQSGQLRDELSRKPTSKIPATKDLTQKQMKERGQQEESLLHHEAFHDTMVNVQNKYGEGARRNLVDNLLSHHDPKTMEAVGNFAQSMGYDPKSPHFKEELLTFTRQILSDRNFRNHFNNFLQGKSDAHIKNLKEGHKKSYQYAKGVTPEHLTELGQPQQMAASENINEDLNKSNYGPPGAKLYSMADNARRKINRTSEEVEGAGPNKAVKATTPSFKQQAEKEATEARIKSRANPVKVLGEKEKLAFAKKKAKEEKLKAKKTKTPKKITIPKHNVSPKKLAASENTNNDLKKAPWVSQDSAMVEIPTHPKDEGKYDSTLVHSSGQRIHRYKLPEEKGTIYATTETGHHSGPVSSQIHVYHRDMDSGEEIPHVAYALTNKGHEGKGLSTLLHQTALKDYGTLGSDRRLSPGSQHIWEKLGTNPNNKVAMGPTTGVEGGEERHMAFYKPKQTKLAASEDVSTDLKKASPTDIKNKKVTEYANKIGIRMRPIVTNEEDWIPKSRGSIQEYDPTEHSLFPAEHELAHVMMTPHGESTEKYSQKIPLHSHFITHHLENEIARRAGIAFSPAHESLDSHVRDEHDQEEFENHILPNLPKGTRNPYKEELPSHINPQEEYNKVLGHFKPHADKIMQHFDSGGKFNETGILGHPKKQTKLAASEDLQKGILRNVATGAAMLGAVAGAGHKAHAASGHLHEHLNEMSNTLGKYGVKVQSKFAPQKNGSKDGAGKYRINIGPYQIDGSHTSIGGQTQHHMDSSVDTKASPEDVAKFKPMHDKLKNHLNTAGNMELERSEDLQKGAVKNALTGIAMGAALASPSAAKAPPQHQDKITTHQAQKTPYSREKVSRAIASVESSGGKNLHHKPTSHGTAFGSHALMPDTIRETIKLNPDLKRQHGKALKLQGKDLHHYMQDNPALYQELVDRHLQRLEHHFGQNPERIGFAWNQGIVGTNKALKHKHNISEHPYVQKFKQALSGEK